MRTQLLHTRALVAVGAALVLASCQDGARQATEPSSESPSAPRAVRSTVEQYATRGERRQGFIRDRHGVEMAVTYEVHGAHAVWQGDIIIGRANEIPTTPAAAPTFGNKQRGVVIDGAAKRWPGGVMPYEIDAAVMTPERIATAIGLIENTTGGITVVPRSGQSDYIRFVDSDGCSSSVGRQGGMQTIDLSVTCSTGSTAHEMLHALGMYHEQSRCDRDNFVEIILANVESGKENNFDMECSTATDYGAYSFGSIMHYPLDAFSSNEEPTIRLRDGVTYSGTIGQRSALGLLDIITMNMIYGSNNIAPVAVITVAPGVHSEGVAVAIDATGSTDADDTVLTYRWNFGDGSCQVFPEPAECTQPAPNHVYKQDGTYKIGLFVFDNYVEVATEQFITITNGLPVVNLGFPVTEYEGTEFEQGGSFTDLGTDVWSATINYGDGSGPTALPLVGKFFVMKHSYADNGAYTITVTVQDDDGSTAKTLSATVTNATPLVDAGTAQSFTSGQTYALAGSFSDLGLNDSPWTWSVNWGFGANSTGSTAIQGALSASRQVCTPGSYQLTLSVTDKDLATGSATANYTVGYQSVVIDITPGTTPNPVAIGKNGMLSVAILSSAAFNATTLDATTITLGDEIGTDTHVAAAPNGRLQFKLDDANRDGRMDVVVMFDVPTLVANGDVTIASRSLVLRGAQGAGGNSCTAVRGADAIKVTPK